MYKMHETQHLIKSTITRRGSATVGSRCACFAYGKGRDEVAPTRNDSTAFRCACALTLPV